jgi:hypothetical protein
LSPHPKGVGTFIANVGSKKLLDFKKSHKTIQVTSLIIEGCKIRRKK